MAYKKFKKYCKKRLSCSKVSNIISFVGSESFKNYGALA
jgi:hypothetical protein